MTTARDVNPSVRACKPSATNTHVLTTGRLPDGMAATRFARRGLAGLIAWPTAEPVFTAEVIGAHRQPWTPHADPRLDALAPGFTVLLHAADQRELLQEAMSS